MGRRAEARAAIERIYALRPDFDARRDVGTAITDGELLERTLDGLRQVGMKIAPKPG
jgi:hypothetical protein